MKRRTITLILVITAIIAVIAFTTLKKETTVEKIILTDSYDAVTAGLDMTVNEMGEFESNSEIYAIIFLKNINIGDNLNIQWKKINGNGEKLVQEDTFIEKQEGSGPLVVSLVAKSSQHDTGSYKIYVKLNDIEMHEKTFTVR